MRMLDILLKLLHLGLLTKEVSESDYIALKKLDAAQWNIIYEMATSHRVAAIVYDGIQRVFHAYGDPFVEVSDAKAIRRKWISIVDQIEKKNKNQIITIKNMGSLWTKDGCKVLLMKGQANALLYPFPEHRTPGDIDCYLYDNYERGCELAERVGAKVDVHWYKHAQISIGGEMFENHKYFVTTRGGKKYRELNHELCVLLDNVSYDKFLETDIVLPPVMFNALFLTYHALAHFLSEGLRLRQIIDWAMFLKVHSSNIDWTQLYSLCDKYRFTTFMNIMNAIAIEDFGVVVHDSRIQVNQHLKQKVIDSLLDDNYIYSSDRGPWSKRLSIINNLIKYRWKYKEIYNKNVFQQLFEYVIGFVLKSE